MISTVFMMQHDKTPSRDVQYRNVRNTFAIVLILASLIFMATPYSSFAKQEPMPTQLKVETQAQHDRRMRWWREARFGMFIHWGAYAVPAGEYNGKRSDKTGEWIMEWANIPRLEFGRATTKTGRVYLHVFEWPADGLLRVPAWNKTVTKAYLLSTPKYSLKFDSTVNGVTVHLPTQAVDPIATVVVLETK